MTKYLKAFIDAYKDYVGQSPRPGYVLGWFSRLRHGRSLYPHIQTLFKQLQTASDDEAANIIINYLKSPKTKFNNHSFSIYLLKNLMISFPDAQWEEYYPKEKQIVFYNGELFRGSLQEPEQAFRDGMTSEGAHKIDEFAKHTNMAVGVSTSKVKAIAERYKNSTFLTPKSAYIQAGYLYQIDYRGLGAVDINKTMEKRGNDIERYVGQNKEEVNIVGGIPADDIVGCWDKNNKWIPNPSYNPNKVIKKAEFFERLEYLFTKQLNTRREISVTDQQLISILENPTKRKLYDYILMFPDNSNEAAVSAALKLLAVITGSPQIFTEKEKFAMCEGTLGRIALELFDNNVKDQYTDEAKDENAESKDCGTTHLSDPESSLTNLYHILYSDMDPFYSSHVEEIKFNHFKTEVQHAGGLQRYIDALYQADKIKIHTYIEYSSPEETSEYNYNFLNAILAIAKQLYVNKKADGIDKIINSKDLNSVVEIAKSKLSGFKNFFHNILGSRSAAVDEFYNLIVMLKQQPPSKQIHVLGAFNKKFSLSFSILSASNASNLDRSMLGIQKELPKTDKSLDQLIKSLHKLMADTSQYKREKLSLLLADLDAFQNAPEFDFDKFSSLYVHCNLLLSDPNFVYKKVSFFGCFTSRSCDLVMKVRQFLDNSIDLIFIDKLKQKHPAIDLRAIEEAIKTKNYRKALELLDSSKIDCTIKKSMEAHLHRCKNAQLSPSANQKLYSQASDEFLRTVGNTHSTFIG